jgi:hypothetical protein
MIMKQFFLTLTIFVTLLTVAAPLAQVHAIDLDPMVSSIILLKAWHLWLER